MEKNNATGEITFSKTQLAFATKVLNFYTENLNTILKSNNVTSKLKNRVRTAIENIKNHTQNYEYVQSRGESKVTHGAIEGSIKKPINQEDEYFQERLEESLSIIAGIYSGDVRYFTEKDYSRAFNSGMDILSRIEYGVPLPGLYRNARYGLPIPKINPNNKKLSPEVYRANMDNFIQTVQQIAEEKINELLQQIIREDDENKEDGEKKELTLNNTEDSKNQKETTYDTSSQSQCYPLPRGLFGQHALA
jgi:hypothetical protein